MGAHQRAERLFGAGLFERRLATRRSSIAKHEEIHSSVDDVRPAARSLAALATVTLKSSRGVRFIEVQAFRPPEQIALCRMAAELREDRRLSRCFHAFANRHDIHVVPHLNDGSQDRHEVSVDFCRGDEAAIDFDHIDRQTTETGKR